MMNRLIVLITICFFSNQFSAQTLTLQENWWQPDGVISAIVKDTTHNLVYLGGDFSSVNPLEEYGTQIDYNTGTVDFQFANPNGVVHTSVSDGVGGWYIGGAFTLVGDSLRNNLAHINHLGEVTAWNPNVIGDDIWVIQLSGSTMYIGGKFTSIGGQQRNNVGAIDAITGATLSWNPNVNNDVYTIAVSPTTIYLGGLFTYVGGQPRNRIASIDFTGTLFPWNPNSNATVRSLILFGSRLYVGGSFTTIGGQTRNRIAAFNNESGALDFWNPDANQQVNVIKGYGSSIYIGGGFTTIGGQSRKSAAAIDTLTGLITPWNINIVSQTPVVVNVIELLNNELIIGGTFRKIGTETHNYFVAVDQTSGQSLNNQFNTKNASNVIYTISVQGDKIYMGGYYNYIGGPARNGLAVFDASTGVLMPWDAGIDDGVVLSLAVTDSLVYVGGTFSNVNGQTYNGLAAFDRATALPSGWNPSPNSGVSTLAISDNELFIGGGFTSMAGESRSKLASFDLTTHTINSWNPNSNHDITAFEFVDTLVYIGGYFSSINGELRNQVAAISRITGQLTSWNPSLENGGWVQDLLLVDSMIYVGGNFTSVGGVDRQFLAEIDRYTGIPTDWNPNLYLSFNGSSSADGVYTIARTNDYLFAGGRFTGANMEVRQGFVALDNQTAQPTSTNIHLLSYESITEVNLDDDGMYMAGTFNLFSGRPRRNFVALEVCYPTYSSTFDTASCNYLWNNSTYNQSGIYVDTLVNMNGCDSICTLNLVIANSESTNLHLECGPYDWTDGNTYSSSGTYTQLLTNIYGCDSLATLVLTILTPTFGIQAQTACTNFTWSINGLTYTTSGTYIDTILNVSGCDSIITLNLTINNPTFGIETITSCNNYLWSVNGQTYTASGTYTDTIPNANGCDSIITLNLTIVPSLPLSLNTFSLPSDANSCIGAVSISTVGEPDFTETIDGGSPITHSGYTLVENLCPGVHSLFTTNGCGDTLTSTFVIPVDSNYVFNNPFIDSIAVDSLGATIEDCDIYYNGIDTAFIDSIFANGNTVTVIWNIVDSNGSNFDTSSYVLNNGNGVYYLQLSVFCPTKSLGEYFAVTEAIYFEDGTISTAGLTVLDDDLFELFPNPTNDLVTIRFEAPKASLAVYDTHGKRITTQAIISGEEVSLAAVETGVYFFELTTEQGKTVKRVVKQ